MISIYLQGGVGNQMFQIAAVLAEAYKNNDSACFDLDKGVYKGQGNHPSYYKDNIFSKLCNSSSSEYTYIPVGYYQSEKYFADYKDRIIDIFINTDIINSLKDKFPLTNSVAVHVRRGDYLSLQQYHPCPSLEYYYSALEMIKADNLLIFSDDINWCKDHFKGAIFIEDQKDYEDLYLMSLCTYHIIANSSFSWWGAYLSGDKNVIAPKVWYGSAISNNSNIYCKEWRVI